MRPNKLHTFILKNVSDTNAFAKSEQPCTATIADSPMEPTLSVGGAAHRCRRIICGLGVVDSPSRGTPSVSIRVFGMDLDERWLRVGCGVGFSCLFMSCLKEFRRVEPKILKERWMLTGILLWLFVWKIKVCIWESGDHDGEGFQALTVGYCPPTLFFTHGKLGSRWLGMLFRSLKGHPSLSACPGFIWIFCIKSYA
ncbi:hypothetical protein V6N11_039806 [Hibiscus sabdariffa]|uniref:Transmembrane protein n=1 Tax=Hibiscus sabdariffa TaxID=183260 RepID=A0ABR2RFY2_9ROSI